MKIYDKEIFSQVKAFLRKNSVVVQICILVVVNICLICVGVHYHNVNVERARLLQIQQEKAKQEERERQIREENERYERLYEKSHELTKEEKRMDDIINGRIEGSTGPKFQTNKIRQDACDNYDEEDFEEAVEEYFYDNIEDYIMER